jgi:hypothetical protein
MALREILATFGIDTSGLEKAGKKGGATIDDLKGGIEKLGISLGGAAIVGGLADMVKGLVQQGSALNDASQQLGINVEDLQSWQFAAKLNGVEADAFNASLKILQKNMAENAANGAESGGKFKEMGVALRDSKGEMRDTTEVLYDTGIAISKLKSPAERTEAALKVFGKAGAKLGPLFNDGEAGLQKYLDEVKNLGGGITGDAVEQLDDLGDNMDRFEMATTSAKSKLVQAFLPTITKTVTTMTSAVVAFTKNKTAMDELKAGVLALGVAGAAAALTFVAPWIPAITGFALLGLLVQDFIVGLNGGDSEIGHLIDELFGAGKGDSFFVQVKKDVEDLIGGIRQLVQDIKNLKSGKTWNDAKELADTQSRTETERKGSAHLLSTNEEAMNAGLSESRKQLLVFAKKGISRMARDAGSMAGGRTMEQFGELRPEQVDTEKAQRMVDKMVSLGSIRTRASATSWPASAR